MKLSYGAVHRLLEETFGRAGDRNCPCGEPAVDWAYQHNAKQEFRNLQGYIYTTDLACYLAMCRACHVLLDGMPRQRAVEPVMVVRSSPEWVQQRQQAAQERRTRTMRELREADPEFAEAMRENSRVNGLAMQQRHLEKLAEDPEYAARTKAAWLANLATAKQAMAERRAADPEFDAKMRAMHQEVCSKVGSATMRMRRRCGVCGVESTPPGMARHQRASGHEGWTDAREDGGSDLRS